MNKTAYLVVWLDLRSGVVTDAGIYSEPTPTTIARGLIPLSVQAFGGRDFEVASRAAARWAREHARGLWRFLAPRLQAQRAQDARLRTGMRGVVAR